MRPLAALACLTLACSPEPTPRPTDTAAAPPAPPGAAFDSAASPWAVSETGAGPVRVGMTTAEARLATGGALSLPVSLDASCEHVRVREAPGGLRFMVVGGRVVRVEVDSATVPTSRGARVGDSEARIRELYGAGVRTEAHRYTTGHYLVVPSPDTTRLVVFETDGRVVTRYYAGRMPEVRWVEGCS